MAKFIKCAGEHWLRERKQGVGGSDAAAAIGESRWTTAVTLFRRKLGLEDDPEETADMKWGKLIEPVLLQVYADETGLDVATPPGLFVHEKLPWMRTTLDGIIVPTSTRRIIEAKNMRFGEHWGEPGTDEIPVEYFAQAHHNMAVMEATVCDVVVLIGKSDFRIYTVEYDPEIREALIERERVFWEYVQRRDPPPARSVEDMQKLFPESRGITVIADDTDAAAYLKATELQQAIYELEVELDEAKQHLMASMEDAEVLEYMGQALCTWKSSKPREFFDIAGFRDAHPQQARKWTKPGKPSRMFLFKKPKKGKAKHDEPDRIEAERQPPRIDGGSDGESGSRGDSSDDAGGPALPADRGGL